MSISMYRDQVDRLRKEIAGLERKRADEVGRAVKEQGDANRVAGSISRTTSESMVRSKLREAERKEKSAADHQTRAAKLGEQVATKQRSLTSAEKNLERALASQRQKDDREARKRQEGERRHLRDMEAARRSLQAPDARASGWAVARAAGPRESGAPPQELEFDVWLSFVGEDRPYVEMVAEGLRNEDVRVFYDLDETVRLWGKDLAEHLDYVYRKASRYCVMFVSEAYARKPWTIHERRGALARALEEEAEYVLPVRFDDTELPGLRPTVAYVDLSEIAPMTLVQFILEKLGRPGIDGDSASEPESS
jgi:hypothetical protein